MFDEFISSKYVWNVTSEEVQSGDWHKLHI